MSNELQYSNEALINQRYVSQRFHFRVVNIMHITKSSELCSFYSSLVDLSALIAATSYAYEHFSESRLKRKGKQNDDDET